MVHCVLRVCSDSHHNKGLVTSKYRIALDISVIANMSDNWSPSFRSHLFYYLSHHIPEKKSRKEKNY